jgi:hypothetical protein
VLRLSLLSGLGALTLFSGAAMADRLKVGEAIINASGPAAKFTVMECFRKIMNAGFHAPEGSIVQRYKLT